MKARISNPQSMPHSVYEIDGCLCKNEVAADYAVARHGVGVVIIELKGHDVEKAAAQVMASAQMMMSLDPEIHKCRIAGLIVSKRVPAGASTTLQKLQLKFRQKFKGPLRALTGDRLHDFDNLLTT